SACGAVQFPPPVGLFPALTGPLLAVGAPAQPRVAGAALPSVAPLHHRGLWLAPTASVARALAAPALIAGALCQRSVVAVRAPVAFARVAVVYAPVVAGELLIPLCAARLLA